jgi:hypothetical protein
MYYVYNKYITVIFFVRGSVKYVFWISRVSQLPVHPLPTITPDNRDYTVLLLSNDARHSFVSRMPQAMEREKCDMSQLSTLGC